MSMGIKDFLVPFGMAWLLFWGIQYFFLKETPQQSAESGQVRQGQAITIGQAQELRPINTKALERGVQLAADKQQGELETVTTDYGTFTFSSQGARLVSSRYSLKELIGGEGSIDTVSDQTAAQDWCFLVALNGVAPCLYTYLGKQERADGMVLTYQGESEIARVQKQFFVHKQKCKIDLELTIEPKQNAVVQPRIFLPAPLGVPRCKYDYSNAIMNNEKGVIKKMPQAKVDLQTAWIAPTFFGLESLYFVHTVCADSEHFIERAYFSKYEEKRLVAILEGPEVQEKNVWHLSFYLGPKQAASLGSVDPKLEELLDYAGIFAAISKWLLYILNYLYKLLGNYGLAIIVMTLLMKLIMFPFTIKTKEQERKRIEYQKKMEYVQMRYKDEPEMLAQKKAELVKKQGLSSLASCLPLLLPLPIFFALSRVLSSSIEFYQAPFLGWIHDLSACDPYFILPGLITISLLLNSLLVDASQRMMHLATALILGAASVNFSAGLSLYTLVNTLFSVIQTGLQNRINK